MHSIREWVVGAALGALLAALVPGAVSAQDVERGETLYGLCVQCHGEAGQGNRMALAPAIAGLPQWYVQAQLDKFRTGKRGAHPDDVGGLRMRPMARWLQSDADVQAVAAFVASLPSADPGPELAGGDPQRGQTLFMPCIACHSADGSGNQALNAPSLLGASDWYLFTQLQHFKAGVRGAAPGDDFGAVMRGMSMTLADEQAMRDVIAYIMTLGR